MYRVGFWERDEGLYSIVFWKVDCNDNYNVWLDRDGRKVRRGLMDSKKVVVLLDWSVDLDKELLLGYIWVSEFKRRDNGGEGVRCLKF